MSLQASENHRLEQLRLRAVMLRRLIQIWPVLETKRLDKTFPDWYALALGIVNEHHGYSAAVAERFVEKVRDEAGISDDWTPPPDRSVDPRKVQLELYRAAIVTLKEQIAKKQAEKDARDRAFVVSAGTATTQVLDGGRDKVLDSVYDDERAVGWYRVTDGDPCYFCAMLAARGIRYKSRETASFHPHTSCACVPAPAYSRTDELPAVSGEAADVYDEATKGYRGKDKIRAFRRAWEARDR